MGYRRGRLPRREFAMRARCETWGVPYERVSRAAVWRAAKWVCALCDEPVDPMARFPDPRSKSLDHIVPLSVPGSPGHVQSNCQLAHLFCNQSKGGRNRVSNLPMESPNYVPH